MRRNPSSGGRRLLPVAIVLAAVAACGWLVLQQADALVARAMLVAFGNDTDSTHRRAWFDWDGDVTAQDVVLHLEDAGDTTLRFDAVRVDTPGWAWLLRGTFDRSRKVAELERLHLTLDGLASQAGIDPSLGDLGPIGALSASPFEAEGCAAVRQWTRSDLGEMGLVAGPTRLEFDYAVAGNELVTRIALGTPGVSRTQFERHETLAKPVNALVLDTVPTMARSERWEVSDQGFVKARNAFCAKQDGVDEATFVARHVDAVQRLLLTRGLAADAATLAAYRDFAGNGGQLAFGGDYPSPLHSTELYAARDDGSAMTRMDAVLEHGSRRVPVQWSRSVPQPLRADAGSTWMAMQAERGTAATPATGGGGASSGAPSASVATTADGRPLASSLPAPALAPPGSTLAWPDLARYQGHVLKVWTMHNEPRTAVLLGADGGEAHVRASVGGGHAEYRIKREAFLRAMLIQ